MATGTVWIAAFYDPPNREGWGIWNYARRKGFTHCLAFAEIKDGLLLIDPHSRGLKVAHISTEDFKVYRRALTLWDARCWAMEESVRTMPWFDLYNCTTVISRLYGLPSWYKGLPLITPYRLACALRDAGAVPFNLQYWI